MGDGAQDVLQSGDWQKVYLISGTSYTCHLSVVRKPAAANLSKTSFSSPLNVSLLYLILGALPQVPKYRQWILEGRERDERWMKVTSSAFRGDHDSSAALLREEKSSGNFKPPGVKAGGNFSSELSKNMEKENSVRIGLAPGGE